jgi:hypothetical protein
LIAAHSLAKIQEENILNNSKGSSRPWLPNMSKNSVVGGNAEVAV